VLKRHFRTAADASAAVSDLIDRPGDLLAPEHVAIGRARWNASSPRFSACPIARATSWQTARTASRARILDRP